MKTCWVLESLLLSSLLLVGASALAVFGPPALCIPFEIGDAETVPEKFGRGFTSATLVDEVAEVLDGNERTLVHMETLRRGILAIHGDRFLGGESRRAATGHQLVSRLRWRVAEALAAPEPRDSETLGRLWFDLGFAQLALHQALRLPVEGGAEAMERALEYLESDGAAHLGHALAMWEAKSKRGDSWQARLLEAWRLEGGRDAHLATSLRRAGEHLVGTSERGAMIAKLKREVGTD